MKTGDRVRIIGVNKIRESTSGKITADFDVCKGNTGTIIESWRNGFGHHPKHYVVKLDPPNSGSIEFLGTDHLEKIK